MKQLFTANLNNEVVAFATNLEDFVNIVHELLPTSQQHTKETFVQKFKENSLWLFLVDDNEIYNFQKII